MKIECHKLSNPEEWSCSEACDTRLDCGHQCLFHCHLQNDPNHLNYSCKKNCSRSCINGHPCRKNHFCFEDCEPCKQVTEKALNCGHVVNVPCSKSIANRQCKEPCERELLTCGHKCLKECSVPCNPCMVSYLTSSFFTEGFQFFFYCSDINKKEIKQLSTYNRSSMQSERRKINL